MTDDIVPWSDRVSLHSNQLLEGNVKSDVIYHLWSFCLRKSSCLTQLLLRLSCGIEGSNDVHSTQPSFLLILT